jgi:hypothetical protein
LGSWAIEIWETASKTIAAIRSLRAFVLMGSILSLEVVLFQQDENSPAMDRCQEVEMR